MIIAPFCVPHCHSTWHQRLSPDAFSWLHINGIGFKWPTTYIKLVVTDPAFYNSRKKQASHQHQSSNPRLHPSLLKSSFLSISQYSHTLALSLGTLWADDKCVWQRDPFKEKWIADCCYVVFASLVEGFLRNKLFWFWYRIVDWTWLSCILHKAGRHLISNNNTIELAKIN